MDNFTPEHKTLDFLNHLWPYISGFTVTLLAVVRLWWYSRQEMKRRIAAVEVLAESNDESAKQIIVEMRDLRKSNDEQHLDIIDKMISLVNGNKL